MALETVDAYGAPSYGPIGRPPAGLVFHTPEWGDLPTVGEGVECATWQATSGNTSGGSYHGILGHKGTDHPKGCLIASHWVMVRSVPWDQACGGLSTDRSSSVWGPGRFPWIQAGCSPAAYSDPNRYFHQIALSGKAAWYVNNGYPPGAVKRCAEWVLTLEGAYSYDALLTLHRHWQLNRSDPGPIDFADRVLDAYMALVTPTQPTLQERLDRKDAYIGSVQNRIDHLEAEIDTHLAAIRKDLITAKRA